MDSLSERPRHFLLLQGLRSPFFARLALTLAKTGHAVTRVQYNVGDHLYWWPKDPLWLGRAGWLATRPKCRSTRKQATNLTVSIRCRVPEAGLAGFYQNVFDQTGATDIVLFGDCRPIHRPAITLARARNINVHVFEEGYFRPDWVTLERDGVNGFSKLPADPDWYRNVAHTIRRGLDSPDKQMRHTPSDQQPIAVGSSMIPRIWHDVFYNTCNLFNRLLYPHYRSHVPHSILAEYSSYISRFIRVQWVRVSNAREVECLTTRKAELAQDETVGKEDKTAQFVRRFGTTPVTPKSRYFLVALQIPGDAQLDFHSAYGDTHRFITDVMKSFVQHAPDDCLLVFKNHPLDPGLKRHDRVVVQLAKALNCLDRVRFLETGHLPTLLDDAAGLVAVNSTTIGQALFHRCATIALGKSMFALPGLTFQGSLDDFWTQGARPDMELYRAFKLVVIHATQINGGLHSKRGIDIAIKNAIPALLARRSKLDALLDAFPSNSCQSL